MIPILTGPTATGKTALALELKDQRIEIINADSMLVYRGMDIGTAKPSPEERSLVPHHLIDIHNPDEPFTAGEFHREATRVISEIESRGNRPLIVGGTGFYLKALLYGLWEAPPAHPELRNELESFPTEILCDRLSAHDPQSLARIGRKDRYRLIRALEIIEQSGKTPSELQHLSSSRQPDSRFQLFIVDRPDDDLFQRIHERTEGMLKAGLIAEVSEIKARFPNARALTAVGYAQTLAYLENIRPAGRKVRPGLPGLADEIELATRQLVKRQRTWFRGSHCKSISQTFSLDQDKARLLSSLRDFLAR